MGHARALDPDFASSLASFDLDALDADASSIVGLWPDLRIAYHNAGWARFAEANGGHDVLTRWPVGASITSAVSEAMRPFLEAQLSAARPGERPVEHAYECSSASEYRSYMMRIHGLHHGHLVMHSLLLARPHDRIVAPPFEALYRGEHGLVVQCSHCRRTRRAASPEQWDWVPDYVAVSPPETSHGLCPVCLGYYYPRSAVRASR